MADSIYPYPGVTFLWRCPSKHPGVRLVQQSVQLASPPLGVSVPAWEPEDQVVMAGLNSDLGLPLKNLYCLSGKHMNRLLVVWRQWQLVKDKPFLKRL